MMGVKTFEEFRFKVGSKLPILPKGNEGRTEFSGLNDLLQYIIDKDKEQKKICSVGH